MARRNMDMASIVRQRLLRLEKQAKAREEDAALESRLAETVERGEERGEEYDRQPQKRGEGRKPIRRLTGLAWLLGKSRITQDQYEIGARYAWAYSRAKGSESIKSILDRDPTSGDGCSIATMLANAEASVYAKEKLVMYRRQLVGQVDLISACDQVCGEEKTPREAAANGRDAEAVEAVLKVALDLMLLHVAPRRRDVPQNVELAA